MNIKEKLYLNKIKNCKKNYDILIKKILNKTPFNNKYNNNDNNLIKIIRVERKCYKDKNEK